MNATVRNKSSKPTAPEKGSFPLDHESTCKNSVEAYMSCLRDNSFISHKCEDAKRIYLSCRMSNGLMEEEDLSNLGLRDYSDISIKPIDRSKEEQGFVAGIAYADALIEIKNKKKSS